MLPATAKLAIEINGVLVPFKSAPDALRRFCVPAFVHSEEGPVDLAVFGSAFVFRYRGRNFALCTRHQFGKGSLQRRGEDFTLTFRDVKGQLHGLNPNRITKLSFKAEEHANFGDLFLAEFEDVRGEFNIRGAALSLDLERTLDTCPPDRLKLMFTFGYPLDEAAYDIVFDEEHVAVAADVVARWMRVYLQLDGPALMDTENRRPMVPDRRDPAEPDDPNGFSGAPVFFIGLDDGNFAYVGFAGIITDARRGRYMVYDGKIIKQVLDRYVDTEEPAPPAVAGS
ncbi:MULTISPECIES: hypothetical protein [Bradyrhizobium]|uniref:hypothetical protein n=1 Tax=Bradyrhizobium TaxID=374 RepID=UPI000D73A8DF|nr:hypothetical protein [Bradyrhizobium diazoefficiens]AWO92691.1 hypothetical protein DI395_32105 [Bradyrhizobium diazoefficiens]